MRHLSTLGPITLVAIALAVSGCSTSVPNDSDQEMPSVPLVTIDTARDRKPRGVVVEEQIEVDPTNSCEITVEFVNGLEEPFNLRRTEDASHEILGFEFSVFRNGRQVQRIVTVDPRFIGDYKPKRLSGNESVIGAIYLGNWYRLEDLAGPCELRLTYDMSAENVWNLTPAHLEKRVGLRIRRGRHGEIRSDQQHRDQPGRRYSTAKG